MTNSGTDALRVIGAKRTIAPPPNQAMELTVQLDTALAKRRARAAPSRSAARRER
jgi:hypothetical protein